MKEFEARGLTSFDAPSTLNKNSFSATKLKGGFVMENNGEGMGPPPPENDQGKASNSSDNNASIENDIRKVLADMGEKGEHLDTVQARRVVESLTSSKKGEKPSEEEVEVSSEVGDEKRVAKLKDELLQFQDALAENIDDPEQLRIYLEETERLINLKGSDFLQSYDAFTTEAFGKEVNSPLDTLGESPTAEEIISSIDRDQVFEAVFKDLETRSDYEVRAMLQQSGEKWIRILTIDTGREDEYVQRAAQIANQPENVKESYSKLVAEIRADVAEQERDEVRITYATNSQEDRVDVSAASSGSADTSPEEKESPPQAESGDGGGEEPPDRPTAEGGEEGEPQEPEDEGQEGGEPEGADPNRPDSFADFDTSRFEGTPLQGLAQSLRRRGNTVDRRFLERIIKDLQENLDSGLIGVGLAREFRDQIETTLTAIRERNAPEPESTNEEESTGASEEVIGIEDRGEFMDDPNLIPQRRPNETEQEMRVRVALAERRREEKIYAKTYFADFGKDFEGQDIQELMSHPQAWENVIKIREFSQEGKTPDEIKQYLQGLMSEWEGADGTSGPADALRYAFTKIENRIRTERELESFRQNQERQNSNPKSVQQVAEQIAEFEGQERWGMEGAFPLLNKDKSLNEANFLKWIRERIMYHHINNSRDTQLNLPGLIGVDNVFGSTISVFTMEKNRNQYFKDTVTGKVLDKLADQLKTEIWLFGNIRNYDLIYKLYMGSDEELPKFLNQVHQKEELTISDSLERILTMSENFGSEQDTKVGDAVRKAYLVYYNISDIEKLEDLLGNDSSFFTQEGMGKALEHLRDATSTPVPDDIKAYAQSFYENGELNNAKFIDIINPFNRKGKSEFEIAFSREMVRLAMSEIYGLDYGEKYDPKEGVNKETGVPTTSERSLHRQNLEYAETWAWSLSRLTGAAARNDTAAIGFDAFTKYARFLDYRLRQSETGRIGQFGKRSNLSVHKKLVQDFFSGIAVQQKPGETEGKISPMQRFLELEELEKKALKDAGKKYIRELDKDQREALRKEKAKVTKIRFDQYTQNSYVSDHIARGTAYFHSTIGGDEAKLHEIVKWEARGLSGRYVIDNAKYEEEFKEKMVKQMRYTWSTYDQLDFGDMEREYDVLESRRQGIPVYKDVVRADAYFGPIVTKDLKIRSKQEFPALKQRVSEKFDGLQKDQRDAEGNITRRALSEEEAKAALTPRERQILFEDMSDQDIWRDFVRSTDGRPTLWKRALVARIAKDLGSHRDKSRRSTSSYMDYEQVEMFIKALETTTAATLGETGEDDIAIGRGGRAFTEEEIKWIRKHSKTEKWRMALMDYSPTIFGGLFMGLWEGMKELAEETTEA